MSWQIKRRPGDFVVREQLDDRTEASWRDKISQLHGKRHPRKDERGGHLWFTMKKTDVDFFKAIDALAKGLGISTKDISYSGTKDKLAITSQTISVKGAKANQIECLRIKGLELSDFREKRRPVRLGEHNGNTFRITVRNIKGDETDIVKERLEHFRKHGFVNYFGEQRFGSVRKSNHIIGKRLVLGGIMDSLGGIPLRKQKLFIHAYQALMWNRTASEYSSNHGVKLDGVEIPILGYKTNLSRHPETKRIISKVLKLEGVSLTDFRIREYPKLSSAGSVRDLISRPKRLSYKFGRDELNKGMKKLVLLFWLGNGCYATELVRQLEPKIH